MILPVCRIGVDPLLTVLESAIGIVALLVDAGSRAVLAVGAPGDEPAAVGQPRRFGRSLASGGVGIDPLLAAVERAVGIVALLVDATAAALLQ
jgi:hypothetical protein